MREPVLEHGQPVAPSRSSKPRYSVQQRRNTCWPLSSQRPSRSNENVAPPSRGLRLEQRDLAPASASSSAAAMPASPPPTTATRHGADRGEARPPTQPFSQPRQRQPAPQHELGSPLDPVEQPPVDAGHRGQQAALRRSSSGSELEAALEPARARSRLEADELVDRSVDAGRRERRSRSASSPPPAGRRGPAEVLADVAQDVGQLQRDAEVVGVRGGVRRGRAPNTPSDSRPIEPATQRQYRAGRRTSRTSVPRDVHLDAVDQLAERLQRDRDSARRVGERDQHRVVALACRWAPSFGADPVEAPELLLLRRARRRRCRRCAARARRRRTARRALGGQQADAVVEVRRRAARSRPRRRGTPRRRSRGLPHHVERSAASRTQPARPSARSPSTS